ncbi:hypothetical protein CXB51_021377 [Gossypium anomalum]|uniref:DUF7745 domain-containing protein n=1 Tax=Gossypium anomalum TaxID=47600 RepID=A0A8J5Y8Y9_9ROSI|nr:hypothetical protein CXB51_021377 [Gossypium anomalum]
MVFPTRFGSEPFRPAKKGKSIRFGRLPFVAQCLDFEPLLESRAHTVPYVFKTFAPLEAYLKIEWPKEVTEQHWVSVFQNLRAEDIMWRAPWIRPSVLLYRVRDQDWVPLLKLCGGIGYAPLLDQRQFSSRQFIPATGGLAQSEFAFAGEGYMKRVRDAAKSWKKIHLM